MGKINNLIEKTKLLIDDYIDADLDAGMADSQEEKTTALERKLKAMESIEITTDNINDFNLYLKKNEALISAEIDVLKHETDLLKKRKNSLLNLKEFMKDLMITAVENIGKPNHKGNLTINSKGRKYTVYNAEGALLIKDNDKIPDDFYNITYSINKAKLKKHIKENGATEYAEVPKIKRIKIS
jgi:hypothetical protein